MIVIIIYSYTEAVQAIGYTLEIEFNIQNGRNDNNTTTLHGRDNSHNYLELIETAFDSKYKTSVIP